MTIKQHVNFDSSKVNQVFLNKLEVVKNTLAQLLGAESLYGSDVLEAARILAMFELASAQSRLATSLDSIDMSHSELATVAYFFENKQKKWR